MKLRIMQQGGGLIYTPFIPESGTATTNSSSKSSSNSEESKIDALDKELIALMKSEDLLPSDIDYITRQLIRFQKQSSQLSALGDYSAAMPGMIQILGAVKKAKFFKNQNDTIATKMAQENAGAEFAIDGNGLIYAWNKKTNQLNKIKPSEFDVNKYTPLSNSELLYYRQTALPNDSQIFNDLSNLVGMGSVIKEIDRIIKEFGTEENAGYISKDKAVQHVLIEANSPDGLYKLTTKKPSGDVSKAWASIYRQLAPNMQHLLNARATISGLSVPEYIHDIVIRNTSTEKKVDYDTSASKAAGYDTDPNKTSSEQLTQNNFLQMVGNLRGSKTIISIAPRAAKINERAAITAPGYTWGRVIDRSNKPIDTQSMSDALKNGWGFAAGDPQTVLFGNKLLKDWELSTIMFDEQSNFSAVMLPYTIEKGHYVPNFELLDKFNRLQEIINNNPNMSRTELQSEIDKLQLNINDIYNFETNTFEIKNTMPFLTVSGIASDDVLDLSDSNKKYLEKMDKEDGKHQVDYYNNMVKYGKLHPEKKAVEIAGYNTAGKNSFWKGNIFIPMQSAFYAMALSGIGEYVPKTSESQFVERVAARAAETQNQYRARTENPNWATIGQF